MEETNYTGVRWAVVALAGLAIVTVGMVVLVLALNQQDENRASTERDSSAPSSTYESNDDKALRVLRETAPYFDDINDSLINEGAEVVCDGFDGGLSVDDVFFIMVDSGFPAGASGSLLAYSVWTECTEHKHLVDAWTSSAS